MEEHTGCQAKGLQPVFQTNLIMMHTASNTLQKSSPLKEEQVPEFENIFRQFNPALCFFARRWVNDMAIAQDIVTDVFVKLWQKQVDFKTVYAIKAFLYISTRNACINHIQQAQYQARVRETIRQTASDIDCDGLNEVIYSEVLRQVYNVVDDLPAKCREVMILSYKRGMNCHEIARKMQLSVHTVRNQKNRGVHLVKNKFRFTGTLADVLC
jgi:RNA polymerase sigma-70 factor (ECF subfamily)